MMGAIAVAQQRAGDGVPPLDPSTSALKAS
jgi:hypothetical protein